jgi:hypothetical protein
VCFAVGNSGVQIFVEGHNQTPETNDAFLHTERGC